MRAKTYSYQGVSHGSLQTQEGTITVQRNTVELLGGKELTQLESASLRLQKMVHIGRKGYEELDEVRKVTERSKERLKKVLTNPVSLPGMDVFTMKLGGRMMVDQAGGVLENANLCLHRNLGFPMIPGSALKGIAGHAAWCFWLEKLESGDLNEARRIAWLIAAVFGYPTGDLCPGNVAVRNHDRYLDEFLACEFPEVYGGNGCRTALAGAVSFLPALPADSDWKLVVDVLTSHPQQDGQEKSPTPIFFLAVERGAAFRFAVAPVAGRSTPEILNFAVDRLKEGLSSVGVGAKTAAGYGWFDSSSYRKSVEQSVGSPEELDAFYKEQVRVIGLNGYEEKVDELDTMPEPFQKHYISRFLKDKPKLLRKWENKNNPRLKKLEEIAEKLNIKMDFH